MTSSCPARLTKLSSHPMPCSLRVRVTAGHTSRKYFSVEASEDVTRLLHFTMRRLRHAPRLTSVLWEQNGERGLLQQAPRVVVL